MKTLNKNLSGIYLITNTANGKRYVGSAICLRNRMFRHLSQLRAGTHENKRLQNAWAKYGEAAFTFSIIEYTERANLIPREQFWIDSFRSSNRHIGYNICPNAGNTMGRYPTNETLKKMSASQIGRKQSPESIAKSAAFHRGRKRSPETCAKISASITGKKQSAEQIASRVAKTRGLKRTDETRAKLSAALRGRKFSPEHRAALSKARMGCAPTFKGMKHSAEARERISAFAKNRTRIGNRFA